MSFPDPPNKSDSGASPPVPDPALQAQAAGAHDPYVALRNPNYRRYFVGNAFSLIGGQMTTFVVGVELYQRTHSAMILGFVGLVQVIPIITMALPVGHFIDRLNRKVLVLIPTLVQVFLYAAMGALTLFLGHGEWTVKLGSGRVDAVVPLMLALLFLNGVCRAINQPTKQSLLPMLVPTAHFPNAITWNASLFETSNVTGPMIGGLALWLLGQDPRVTFAYALVYWANAACQLINWLNIYFIRFEHKPRPHEPLTLKSMLAGAKFVWHDKVILGAITLDMFAVLLGGATMMLPVFAEQVLFVGPFKLAILRAAASIGSITMALSLAHRPPMQNAGRNLLWAVVGFGTSIIVFGLSRNFYLSAAALFFTGFFDNISVVVRHSLVQLRTPDEMRGRVSAVNTVFISTSNELGDTESGFTTELATRFLGQMLGPMVAVAAGGVGTILVVAAAAVMWPQIAAVKRLDRKENRDK